MFSRKDLVKLVIPLIVEQLFSATLGMADVLMVAYAGETAVSGVSLVDTINMLILSVFAALATGGSIVSAQYIGREDLENGRRAAKQLLLVTFVLSSLVMLVCVFGQYYILRGLYGQAEEAVLQNAHTYFLITSFSFPAIALYNAGTALFRSMGNSKVPMFTSGLMCLGNIAVNAVLIYGFKLGVLGAAVATLFSRTLCAVIVLALLHRRSNPIHIDSYLRWKPNFPMIKSILSIGIPTGLENGLFNVGKILVQSLIASFGTAAIAANAVANQTSTMSDIPGSAIGLGLITVVGQCVGAGNYPQARKYTLKLVGSAYAMMAVLNVGVLLFVDPILSIFNLSAEAAGIARELMIFYSITCAVIWPAAFTLPNCLRAANDVKFTMSVSILSMWVFRIGFSYLIAAMFQLGVLGVWIAMVIDWIFRAILFIIRFSGSKWQQKRLI
ncbi:MAG: MATE family efflux transporter [Oscillospiraceae bacterium]|nr:MATE family efflux transporter [Oscillospiraceae bacterium]